MRVAFDILRALGLRKFGPELIACPSCGRTNVEVHELAETVERRLTAYREHFEVAVMGCAVNGPGEAGDADFGIAGGRDAGHIYAHGQVLRRVPQERLVDELFAEIDRWIAAGMPRPGARPPQARPARPAGPGRAASMNQQQKADRHRRRCLRRDGARRPLACARRPRSCSAAPARSPTRFRGRERQWHDVPPPPRRDAPVPQGVLQ